MYVRFSFQIKNQSLIINRIRLYRFGGIVRLFFVIQFLQTNQM